MKKNYYLKRAALIATLLAGSNAWSQTTTFNYTGSMQTYVVPPGVSMINIESWGAQGEDVTETYSPQTGGLGGYATGDLSVTPGETLYIYVGGEGTDGAGGFNGGGTGGFGTPSDGLGGYAGSGGGASDVRQGGTTLAERIIVAGGGGGAGRDYVNGTCVPCGTGGNGGDGGGTTGLDGDDPADAIYSSYFNPGAGGKGGTPTTGGLGGDGPEGIDGNPGVLGVGGIGINGSQSVASGGGGGGYYGGGAGAGAGGGSGAAGGGGAGGSSYTGTLTSATITPGVNSGNGVIIITELCNGLATTVSSDSVCEGDEVVLHAESTGTGTVSWDGGITDSVAFVPSVGTTTYTATSTDTEDCDFVIEIFVGALPTVDAGADVNICEDDSALVYGAGTATDWSWDGGISDSTYFTPSAGTTTYTLTGTIDSTGCMATDMVDVTYNVVDSTTTVSGITLTATQAGATYQWIACPALTDVPGATSQSFVPTQDGSYAVIIDLNGCVDTSDCKTIAGVGINENGNLDLNIYPNPTQGDFTLQLSEVTDGTVVIYSTDGKLVYSETINAQSLIDLSLEDMESGLYIIEVQTNSYSYSLRLIKE